MSAARKTNPRLMETIGNIDLVPAGRRVGGPGASFLMAPFTHVSPDRPSRFSDGTYGVLYAGDRPDVALLETVHHHGRFMARTKEPAGWSSEFQEITLDVVGRLHDVRHDPTYGGVFHGSRYDVSRDLGARLRKAGADGVVYPSVRCEKGECVGLCYPDLASNAATGRRLLCHWNGKRIDYCRDVVSDDVYRVT